MIQKNRKAIPVTLAFVVVIVMSAVAGAATQSAGKNGIAAAIKQFTMGARIESSPSLEMLAPDIPERHDNVRIRITSKLNSVDEIRIYVDTGMTPLVAAYRFKPTNRQSLTTSLRLKRHGLSRIVVVAKSKGRYFKVEKSVRTVIGCGGGG